MTLFLLCTIYIYIYRESQADGISRNVSMCQMFGTNKWQLELTVALCQRFRPVAVVAVCQKLVIDYIYTYIPIDRKDTNLYFRQGKDYMSCTFPHRAAAASTSTRRNPTRWGPSTTAAACRPGPILERSIQERGPDRCLPGP